MKTALIVLALFIASVAAAADYSDLYVIPIAGHARGAFGTQWRSDVVLHNLQLVPITVEMALVESGRSPDAAPIAISSLQLNPGETRTLADVLGHEGRDLAGALIVGASMPFVVTSRTYAERPTGRTLGQTVEPIAMTGGADAVNDVAILAGLTNDAHHRTNIGVFLAASRAPFVAEIELVSASGASLGSTFIDVGAEGLAHHQFPVTTSGAVSAIVRIVQGDGIVVPYASIINNTSAEAMFVSASAAKTRSAAAVMLMMDAVVER